MEFISKSLRRGFAYAAELTISQTQRNETDWPIRKRKVFDEFPRSE